MKRYAQLENDLVSNIIICDDDNIALEMFGAIPSDDYVVVGFKHVEKNGKHFLFAPNPPFPSWKLNEETYIYESPVPKPQDDNQYRWDEEKQEWIIVVMKRATPIINVDGQQAQTEVNTSTN